MVSLHIYTLHIKAHSRRTTETMESGHVMRMPNPDCALAEGNPLYVSWIDVFGDDVSGNRSKSWNKHWKSISVTETYHESFFNKSSTHILYQLPQLLVLLSSFMVLNRSLSMLKLFKWHSGTNYCYLRKSLESCEFINICIF